MLHEVDKLYITKHTVMQFITHIKNKQECCKIKTHRLKNHKDVEYTLHTIKQTLI